ncbi:hypothetical protein [Agarivorans litoreus]|uniref:hypothetical protein n=1 Tax=Agarivorans litoreus TaxID=1510455 RepID=UPI001C7DC41E|nr:hypothetical protein [Agarivorans litoreus]
MAESHVISALVSKHSELAGQIKHYQLEIARLSKDLSHVEATIKVFEPEYDVRTVTPKRTTGNARLFKPRECQIMVLDILRVASEPLTTTAIADKVHELKRVPEEHQKQLRNTVATTLRQALKANQVNQCGKEGLAALWEIAA